jgi:hypothetical protein
MAMGIDKGFPMPLLQNIPANTIYLMGGSFVLGSFCTLLLLILMDMMREYREKEQEEKDDANP